MIMQVKGYAALFMFTGPKHCGAKYCGAAGSFPRWFLVSSVLMLTVDHLEALNST